MDLRKHIRGIPRTFFLQGRMASQRERAWDRDWPGLVTSNALSNLRLLLVYIFSKINPLNTDTRILLTVSFVATKSLIHIFSKINPLLSVSTSVRIKIRTLVNTDSGQRTEANSHISLKLCQNYLLIVGVVSCSTNDRFLRVATILLIKGSGKIK